MSGVLQQSCGHGLSMVDRHLQMSSVQRRHGEQRLHTFDDAIQVGSVAWPNHTIHTCKDKPQEIKYEEEPFKVQGIIYMPNRTKQKRAMPHIIITWTKKHTGTPFRGTPLGKELGNLRKVVEGLVLGRGHGNGAVLLHILLRVGLPFPGRTTDSIYLHQVFDAGWPMDSFNSGLCPDQPKKYHRPEGKTFSTVCSSGSVAFVPNTSHPWQPQQPAAAYSGPGSASTLSLARTCVGFVPLWPLRPSLQAHALSPESPSGSDSRLWPTHSCHYQSNTGKPWCNWLCCLIIKYNKI